MSTLVYDTLETELVQEIVVGNHLGLYNPTLKPWLYFLNNPAGTFTLSIYKGVDFLMSKSFTLADLKTQLNTTDKSGYLFFNLDFGGHLPFGFYTLKLTSTGYTYSNTSFLAWCKDWESNFESNPNLATIEWTQYPLAVRVISMTPRES